MAEGGYDNKWSSASSVVSFFFIDAGKGEDVRRDSAWVA